MEKKNYKLIQARDFLNITQEEFAKELNMDKSSYSFKEAGKRKIWIDEANRIIEKLNEIAKLKGINISYNYNDIFLN